MTSVLLAAPVLAVFPWVSWHIMRLSAQWKGERTDPAATKAQLRKAGVAIGWFEIAVASCLLGFAIEQGDYTTVTTSGPALVLVGLGFILWGRGRFDIL